ncbi:mandelate racemase/muconate lactonizing enzyme family protein [Actinocatenispora comari]|uniref:Dipeptide epimerase n=1 Tax=Actinocatenispora comari TaxID=2807577 RepID=A0A8J4EIM5_9ACTN|nr:enolase C-terminal domain-like protein [Actinocatenispora comari]GIL25043.1 dipeptide epimerase [Actinocatenispora comari]
MTYTIRAVQTAPVSLTADPALTVHGAKGAHDRSDFLLVRIIAGNDSGREITGYGEVSATPLWSGEDGTTAAHLIRTVLTPVLIGMPLAPVGAAEAAMDRALAGNPFTKAGVATALWDAWARVLDVPLAVALGGPYRTEVPIKLSLSGDGAVLETVYHAARAAGFGAFKVKVGLGVDGDLARVARARELVGPDTFLGVDANGGWNRAEAARAVAGLAPYGVAFVEQPVAADDLDGLRAIRALGVTVVADESVFGLADLVRVIRADAADVASVYIGKAGGPGRAVQLARIASAFGIRSLLGSNGELGIGAAAQLHAACAIPDLATELPSDIIGAHYYTDDILAEPLDSNGSRVRINDRPGLGVTPRPDLLDRFS